MQSAVLLAVLLPVALAALCPCPSPSPEDTVCGSDGRTYSSECELQCTGLPGLSAAHPGPCNTTVVASRRRRYTVEYPEWEKCYDDRQCGEPHLGNCSECGAGDWKCRGMCHWNCVCACAGLPTGGLDKDSHDRWDKCINERKCTKSKSDECKKNCGGNQFCRNLCHMDWARCGCSCVQHVADTRTSTTAAPTSTTAAPTSTTTAPTSTTTVPTSTTTAPTSTTAAPTSTTTPPTTSTTTATRASSSPSATEAVTGATEVETNNTQAVTSASGTTATVAWTWRNYMACAEQSRECGRDSLLPDVRRANCTCGCMGLPGGDLEVYASAAVQRCLADCGGLSCKKLCQKDECHDNCHLRELRCRCECSHRARATAANSTDKKLNN